MHYVQPDVGHYGVFNGSRFRQEIVPRIVEFTRRHGKQAQPTKRSKRKG
jgi:poly(3-hydroxybutyrate) depolymerase